MDNSVIVPTFGQVLSAKFSTLMSQPDQIIIVVIGFLLVLFILRFVAKTVSLIIKIIIALIIATLIAGWLLYRTPIFF